MQVLAPKRRQMRLEQADEVMATGFEIRKWLKPKKLWCRFNPLPVFQEYFASYHGGEKWTRLAARLWNKMPHFRDAFSKPVELVPS